MIVKCRAWDKINKFMIDLNDSDIYGRDYVLGLDGSLLEVGVSTGELDISSVNADVMYFTGLVDENGVDVYRGDILKIHVDFELRKGVETEEVIWDEDLLCYTCSDWTVGDLQDTDNFIIEVVGNVYQRDEEDV